MRAMQVQGFGEPLRRVDVPMPKCGPNDALLRVKAVGVGLTIVIMLATPGHVSAYPRIPGHEIAAEVVEVGSEVANVRVGDRVTCHFYLTCGACRYCRTGRETLCTQFRGYVGMACDGGYAEYVSLPARNLVHIPTGVGDAEAAVAADAICTAYHSCVREAQVTPGDDVLVVGAGGGVGIHVVQMARLCGGRVIAADIGEAKLALARRWGADATIDVTAGDLTAQALAATDGRGVDAIVDIVANQATMSAGIAALAPGGRLAIVGMRPVSVFGAEVGAVPLDPILMLRRGLEIHGSRYVNYAEIEATLKLVAEKRITPVITQTFALEEAEAAHELLRTSTSTGRLALTI